MAYQIYSEKKPVIRGVLFDMDGLVLDTEKLYTRFWMEAAHDLGFPMTREQALGLRSLGGMDGQRKMWEYFGETADYGTIRDRRVELMDAHIAQNGVEAKPGISELLADLKEKGIRCAITSSSSLPVIRAHLGSLGLADKFDELCSGKNVAHGKPAPDIYLHGANCLGLKPEECLALEDSPAGIESAYRAGCYPVLIPDLDTPGEETIRKLFAKCDSLIDVIGLVN